MKKFFKRLCVAILVVVMLSATAAISSASLNASAEEVFVLPDSVDNSQSPYFPEIESQGGIGSCTSWANVYYSFTYAMNKSRGIKTTPENTYSPQWSYPLTSDGEGSGTLATDVAKFLKKQGAVPLSMVPYEEDFVTWCPDYDVWRESINNRIADKIDYKSIGRDNSQITSVDDDDLTEIKTALANGEILTFSTKISSRVTTTLKSHKDAPGNEEFLGEVAVKYFANPDSGHAMTIVGYNDNIWVDINENDKIDSGEMGAFKIANSWGSDWGNDGFIWFAYDAANKNSAVEGFEDPENRFDGITNIMSFVPRPYGDGTDVYIRYYFKTGDRRNNHIIITAEKDGNEYTYKAYFPINALVDTKIPYEGNMVVALDNVISDISAENFKDYNWSVTFVDQNDDECTTTYDNAEIVIESTGEVFKPQNAYPFTLNGEEKTIEFAETSLNHATVYYRGYDNPQINYNVNDQWINSFMESNTQREGYLYKFVVDLEDKDSAQIFFTDEKGNKDDNLGENFTVTKGLNYFVTEGVVEPLEIISLSGDADVYECGMTHQYTTEVKGGYEPYTYKYVFENHYTGEINEVTFPKNFCNRTLYRSGNYRVTVIVTDYAGTVARKSMEITVIDSPFEFSEFEVINDGKLYSKRPIDFHAVTKYESILPVDAFRPQYDLVIKKDGEVCYEALIDPIKISYGSMTSVADFSWTPTEAGHYTATISETDYGNDYAEKTIEFDVINPERFAVTFSNNGIGGYGTVGAASEVEEGRDYTFSLALTNGYDIESVTANGNVIEASESSTDIFKTYTVKNVTSALNIYVSVREIMYDVTISSDTPELYDIIYYNASHTKPFTSPVKENESCSFGIAPISGYAVYAVAVNGEVIEADLPYAGYSGTHKYYTIDNVTSDLDICVTVKSLLHKVTFSSNRSAAYTLHGSASGAKPFTDEVYDHETYLFGVTAVDNYVIEYVSVNGEAIEADPPYAGWTGGSTNYYSVPDVTDDLNIFIKVYEEIVDVGSTDPKIDYPEPTPETETTGLLKLDLTGGTSFKVKIGDGAARPQGATYYNSKTPIGSFVTVTAAATNGAEFIGWTNPANGQIVSTDLTFSFYASGNDYYQAIFVSEVEGVNMVMFHNNKAGQYWDMQYYAAGEEINYPDGLPHYGYEFIGWDHTDDEIQAKLTAGEDVTVTATWERVIVYIDVNAVGGTIVTQPEANGQYIAGRAVEVTANEAESGKKFAYWVDEKGVVRSFETTYKFYPTVNTTMTAVFVSDDETVDCKVLVSVDSLEPTEDGNGSFIFSWYVPEVQNNIKYQASGIVAVNKDNYDENTLVHGTSEPSIVFDRTITGKDAIPSNSASWIGPVKDGQTWVAKAWVQYTDADGVLHTEYSDLFEVTKD